MAGKINHNDLSYGPWALAKFYFHVTINSSVGDGATVDAQIGFQTVEGMESEVSVMEYRAGNYSLWAKTKRPGMMTYSNVTLNKGMLRADANLLDWWKKFAIDHRHSSRSEVIIELYNEDEEAVIIWTLKNCFCVKFTPTGLDAEADSEVAVEELEFCYEEMNIDIA